METQMDFLLEENRISLRGGEGELLAEVVFPPLSEGVVRISHTFVDDRLRGRGVASELMEALAEVLRRSGRKAVPECAYAARWFEKHPQHAPLVLDAENVK